MGKWDYDEVGILMREFNSLETKLAQHEEELNRKNNELLQSNKLAAIGTLAAGVAHELNNPLNNIYLSVQVLQRIIGGPECPAPVREIVGDITTQTARVKHIVGELLEFARGREPETRKIELKNLLSRAFKAVRNTLNVDNIIFSVNSDRDDLIIEADPDQMEQVFINLFHNAIEAMDGAGTLEAAIESQGDVINISVSDTGKGIPPEVVAKLFEPFFSTKDKGTGLGLAITFNIIQKHGGEIRAESETGKGSAFYITLPKERDNHVV
jgi:signal transduction histidine kinase